MKKETLKKLIAMTLALCLLSFACLSVSGEGTSDDTSSAPAELPQPVSTMDFESVETIDDLLEDANWQTSNGTAAIETEGENRYVKITSQSDAGNALLNYRFVGSGRPVASGESFTLMYRISFDHDSTVGTGSSFRVALGDAAAQGYFTSFYNAATNTGNGAWSLQSSASNSNTAARVGDFAHSTWHDVIWVYDAANPDTSTIYIDGMKAAEEAVYPRNGDTTPTGLFTSVDTAGGFSIRLDDIRIYSGVVDVWSTAETTAVDYGFGDLLSDPEKADISAANMNSDASLLTEAAGKFGKAADDNAVYINNTVADAGEDSYINFAANTNAQFHAAGDSQSLSVNFAFDPTMRTVKLNGYAYYLAEDGTIRNNKLTYNGLNVAEITPTNVRLFGENYPMETALLPEQWYTITLVIYTSAESGGAATYSAYLNGKELCPEKTFDNDTFIRISNNPETYTSMSNFRGFSSLWLNYSWNSSTQTDVNDQLYREAPGGIYFDDVKLTTYFGHKPVMDPAVYTLESGDWMTDKWLAGNTYYVKSGSTLETVKPALPENITATYRGADGTPLADTDTVNEKAYGELRRDGAVIGYICLDAQNTVILSDICAAADNWTGWNRLDAENKTASQKGGKAADDTSLSLLNAESEGNTGEGYIDYPLQSRSAGRLKNVNAYKPVTVSVNVYMPEVEENRYFRISAWQGTAAESAESLQSKFGFANGMVYRDANSSGGIGEAYCDYVPGEWNRVSYTFYPGEGKMDISINGIKIAENEGIDVTTSQRLAVLRFETTYQTNPVYVDDIAVYAGYSMEEAYPQNVTAASGAELEVIGNTIGVPSWFVGGEPYSISELLYQLDYSGTIGVYSDHTFTSSKNNNSSVAFGDVLMLTAENTFGGNTYNTYKYYTVVPSDPFILTQNGSVIENGGTYTSGEISVTPYTSEGVMIIAVYGTSVPGSQGLERIETVELDSFDAGSCPVTVDDAANTVIRVMIWDSLSGMIPLSTVYEADGTVSAQ